MSVGPVTLSPWHSIRKATTQRAERPQRSSATVRRLRPFARPRASTIRPFFVAIRTRKPCAFARRRVFGWNVRLPFIPGPVGRPAGRRHAHAAPQRPHRRPGAVPRGVTTRTWLAQATPGRNSNTSRRSCRVSTLCLQCRDDRILVSGPAPARSCSTVCGPDSSGGGLCYSRGSPNRRGAGRGSRSVPSPRFPQLWKTLWKSGARG
jgi:hypothetical protein